jgi:GntR family transcriptional repressor for pyruvate dehydrogenase complex
VGHQEREKLPYEKWPDTVLSEHRDLVEAIERQNPEAARAASIRHLEKSRDRIQTLISPNKKNAG